VSRAFVPFDTEDKVDGILNSLIDYIMIKIMYCVYCPIILLFKN
jgi:hypothetical protein